MRDCQVIHNVFKVDIVIVDTTGPSHHAKYEVSNTDIEKKNAAKPNGIFASITAWMDKENNDVAAMDIGTCSSDEKPKKTARSPRLKGTNRAITVLMLFVDQPRSGLTTASSSTR